MANPEHVRWLLEGVTTWNARRLDPNFIPDLSGEDITARLRGTQMTTSDERPNLNEVNLSQALLYDCNFSDTNLAAANLSGSNLMGTRFKNSQLIFANLTQFRLHDSDLTGANLMGANLRQANLTNCTLTDTELTDTDLSGANLTDSRSWQARMRSFSSILWHLPPTSLTGQVTSINDILPNVGKLKNHYAQSIMQEPPGATHLLLPRGINGHLGPDPKCNASISGRWKLAARCGRGDVGRSSITSCGRLR